MPSVAPFASARAKIDRASKHISEVSETLRNKRPFRYILETDAKAGRRAVGAERNHAVINELALICGDAIHNLRSAIDHAYYTVVAPVVLDERERTRIQFPVAKTAAGLKETAKNRLAKRVAPEFFDMIVGLKAHGEKGGNHLLYLLHTLDVPDKHASFIPTADYTTFTGEMIKRFAPDCPVSDSFRMGGGKNSWDLVWDCKPLTMYEWIALGVPPDGILKQEIDFPVQITFDSGRAHYPMPAVPTLYKFVDVTGHVVNRIAEFG